MDEPIPSTSSDEQSLKKSRRDSEDRFPKKVLSHEEISRILQDCEYDSDDGLDLLNSDSSRSEEEDIEENESLVQLFPQSVPEVPNLYDFMPPSSSVPNLIQEQSQNATTSQEWHSNPTMPPQIPFINSLGLKVVPSSESPFGYFQLLFTDNFFEYLAKEANAYSVRVLSASPGPRSRINNWTDVIADELKTFIGIIFLMGIIRLNRVNDCWKQHYLFNLSFHKFMSRDRFLIILRCLHFQHEQESNDPIFKIRPIMNYFNSKMEELCFLSRYLTIDESMVLWRGRLAWRQFLPGKRHKYGLKLFVLANPIGLVHKLYIYGGGKDTNFSGASHTAKVVEKLMEGTEGKGHSLFIDNSYNSVDLVRSLLSKKTYCTATLKSTRKGNPIELVSKRLERGESFSLYSDDGICCCKWRDKRDVYMISSEFSGDLVQNENRRGQSMMKPKMVIQYNRSMKGIDRQDQMLAYHPQTHKSISWYKKLGIHLFTLMLNNAYILYSHYSGEKKKDLHDFHLEIISTLLPDPSKSASLDSGISHIHLPELLPKQYNNKTMRKRCVVCYSKKIRNDTIYHCPSCVRKPGLCLTPCFREYHKYK